MIHFIFNCYFNDFSPSELFTSRLSVVSMGKQMLAYSIGLMFYTDCFLLFQAVTSGLLKILSKMGISLLSRYPFFFFLHFYMFVFLESVI